MTDSKCDSCHRKRELTLTSIYEMLCATCMHDQYQTPLMDVLAEREAHEVKEEAMKKLSEDFERHFKKDDKDE